MEDLNKKPGNEFRGRQGIRNTEKAISKKLFLVTIAVAVVLLACIWIWKSIEISNIKKSAERDRQSLKEQATRQIVQVHEEHLKLLAKPFVWAVRAEMMQGNMNQVNLFSSDLIKEKNFQRIVIANDKGVIVASTNKKDEGQLFSGISKEAYLSSNNTVVDNESDSVLSITSPIMGFNNRLGTMLIKYAIQQPAFK